jgi:hypothetical protein
MMKVFPKTLRLSLRHHDPKSPKSPKSPKRAVAEGPVPSFLDRGRSRSSTHWTFYSDSILGRPPRLTETGGGLREEPAHADPPRRSPGVA